MKYNNMKKKIIIITVIILIIITALLWMFFNTDIFRTKRGAFFRYFTTAQDALETLKISDFDNYNNLKENKAYVRKSEMTIKSSSNIADSNILDKIKLTMTEKVNNQKETANSEISIKSNNQELANISYVREKNIYGIYCPLISNGYVCVKNENLKNLTSNINFQDNGTIISSIISELGLSNSSFIPKEIEQLKLDKLLEITKTQQSKIESYYSLMKNNIPNTAYSKNINTKIKIEDTNYKVNSYTIKLSQKESANLEQEVLEKLSQDSVMMDFITSKFKLLSMDDEYTDINLLNEKIKSRIEKIKNDSNNSKELEITVNEYKQKNIETKIVYGDTTIIINHLKEENNETTILTINNASIKIMKTSTDYTIKLSNISDEIKKSIEINYKQAGTIEDNNIQNIASITLTNGAKVITFAYNDQITFSDDVGTIKDFSGSNLAILNEFNNEKVNTFIKNLKQKINQVYIAKGASIGINLDPIFE